MTAGPRPSPFALYWTSATASYLGDGVRLVAVPLLAATLTARPAGIALVSAAAGVPWLLFGLVAGVAADRLRRDRLMTSLQAVRGCLGLALVAMEVIGVVGNVKQFSVREPPRSFIYLPFGQHYESEMTLHVSTASEAGAEAIAAPVRALVAGLDPALPSARTLTVTR